MIQPYVTLTERGILSVAIAGEVNMLLFEGKADRYSNPGWPEEAPSKPKGWEDAVTEALADCKKRLEDDHEASMATSYGRKFG